MVTDVVPIKLVPVRTEVVPPLTSPAVTDTAVKVGVAVVFHSAYRVVFAVILKADDCEALYEVVVQGPVEEVFQPAKTLVPFVKPVEALVVTA